MKPVIIIVIAFVCLFVPTTIFAEHRYEDYDPNDPVLEGKTPLRVYTIFASATYFGCGDFDSDKLAFFKMLTTDVLRMYDFLPITSNPYECVKVSGNVEFDKNNSEDDIKYGLTLDDALEKAKNWHYDLLIIIFDNKLSNQYFTETAYFEDGKWNVWAGHIEGTSNTIVSTSDLRQVEEQEGAWILSHELAHFALRYQGNPHNIWVDYVHRVHDDYRECQRTQFQNVECVQTYSKVKAYGGYFKILKPYEKPTYSDPIIKDSDGDGYADNKDSCPTQRENFNGYQDSDGCPDNPNTNENKVNTNLINELVTDYVNKKTNLKYEISNKINKYQKLSFESPLGNAKHGSVLNQLRSINFETSDYNVNVYSGYWMDGLHSVGENGVREEIKKLYGISNKIKQLDSEITKAHNLESEFKSKQTQDNNKLDSQKDTSFVVKRVELVKIKLNSIKTNEPIIGYVTDSDHYWGDKRPNFILSKQTNQGWKEVITVEGKFGNGWYEGSFGEARHYSDGKYKMNYMYGNTDTRILYQGTAYFKINNNQESDKLKDIFMDSDKDGILNDIDLCPTLFGSLDRSGCPESKSPSDKDDDGVPDSKDTCPELAGESRFSGCPANSPRVDTEGDGVPDSIDVCPNVKGTKDNDGCPDTKPKSTENNQSQKMKLQDEAMILQQESYSKLKDFKKDVLVSKKSLEQVSANSPKQQKTLDNAWDLLESNQIILSNMEERFQKGDREIGDEKYDSTDYLFDVRSHESKRIGENLVEISRLIEESKSQITEETNPTSCFLWWCW